MDDIETTFLKLDAQLRRASIAQIGGFRPCHDLVSSWFGGDGFGRPDESTPPGMFPLLQVVTSELPFCPPSLTDVAAFVVFLNREAIPFDKPHGEGWLIREYGSVEGLVCLKKSTEEQVVKPFPIRWELVTDDAPSWETAWELVDLKSINESEEASKRFFETYNNRSCTKVGGFPYEIQHGLGGEGEFIFQIGSEEKPKWMWVDNGIGYFLKNQKREWEFQCQFY